VAFLSFAINYYFGRLNVYGYHLVNLLIHLICSIFLFLFIYRTLLYLALKKRWEGDAYFVALLATVLWAINPIQTQAVTYIVQRMASIAAMFYIIGMYFYLKGRTLGNKGKKVIFFALCFFCFLLALGCKENAAMFPVCIFLYEALIMQDDPWKFLCGHYKTVILIIAITACAGAGYLYLETGKPFPEILDGYRERPFTLGQRLLTQPRVILFYISLLLYPMPNRLCIVHDFPVSTSLFSPITTSLSLLAILAMIGLAIFWAKKRPLISFSIFFFFMNHLIESSILPLEMVFEHRNYLPSMMFFIPPVIGLSHLLRTYQERPFMKWIISSFVVLSLVGFGHSTFMRNFTWKNDKSLWIDAVDKSPDLFRPHHNLGNYFHKHKNLKDALHEYMKALEMRSAYKKNAHFITYYNLGKLFQDKGELEKAKSFYQKAIKLNPWFPAAYMNLASVFDREGKEDAANRYLLKSISMDPSLSEAKYNLALLYLKQGCPLKALPFLNSILNNRNLGELVPLQIAIAYKQLGEYGLAVTFLQKALSISPGNMMLHLHLAEIYDLASMKEKALKEVNNVLRMLPDEKSFNKLVIDGIGKTRGNASKLKPSRDIIFRLFQEACTRRQKMLKEYKKACQKMLNSR